MFVETAAPARPKAQAGPARFPSASCERRLKRLGFRAIAGLDEAGRGSWAGPLVAAAVVLPPATASLGRRLQGVRDSKQLGPAQRERLSSVIESVAKAVGLGVVSPDLVDQLGLTAAGQLAMRRAVLNLAAEPDYLLIDAFGLPGADCPQEAIVFGDSLCLSIAAASVIAKVRRDHLLEELGGRYPGYGFEDHKGYGTPRHWRALRTFGPIREHRFSYAPVRTVIEEAAWC